MVTGKPSDCVAALVGQRSNPGDACAWWELDPLLSLDRLLEGLPAQELGTRCQLEPRAAQRQALLRWVNDVRLRSPTVSGTSSA
jgi:hypothetical protein